MTVESTTLQPLVIAAADHLAAWDVNRVGQLASGTVSFNLRMRGAGRTGIAIEGTKDGDARFQIWVTPTGLALTAAWEAGMRRHDIPAIGLDDGAWHQVVIASGQGRVRAWVDGDLVYQAPGEAWFADGAALPEGIDELVIGRSSSGERLMGEVAQAVFYGRPCTHEEALAVMGLTAPKGRPLLVNHDGFSYRIPAVICAEGTLIVVADRRHNGPGDAPNVIDLVHTRSTDGGQSWSDPTVFVPPFKGGASTDACLVYDQATRTIWAFFSAYAPGHSQPAVLANEPGAKAHIQAVTSQDGGLTWSDPIEIVPTDKADTIRCLGVSPGAGAVMADGTVLVPAYHEVVDDQGRMDFAATVLTSTDHGVTWQVGNPVAADGYATYESTVFEGEEVGQIVLMARNQHPSGRVLRAVSHDRGYSWTNVAFLGDVPEIFSQPSSVRLNDGRIAFCNPSAMLPHRGWGVVRVSADAGKTWPIKRTINADRHGYQSLAILPDGEVVVVWEHEWDSIDVTICPPDWLPGTPSTSTRRP